MHEHLSSAVGAYGWLHILVAGLVLPTTLFALRRLVSDWDRLSDRLTPATHVTMGIAMSCMILAPWVPPSAIGALMLAAVAVAICHRALAWWSLESRPTSRGVLDTPALAMMLVMAVMSVGAERDSPALTTAMLGCLVGCAAAYAVPMMRLRQRVDSSKALEVAAPLVLTVGMLGMLAMP